MDDLLHSLNRHRHDPPVLGPQAPLDQVHLVTKTHGTKQSKYGPDPLAVVHPEPFHQEIPARALFKVLQSSLLRHEAIGHLHLRANRPDNFGLRHPELRENPNKDLPQVQRGLGEGLQQLGDGRIPDGCEGGLGRLSHLGLFVVELPYEGLDDFRPTQHRSLPMPTRRCCEQRQRCHPRGRRGAPPPLRREARRGLGPRPP